MEEHKTSEVIQPDDRSSTAPQPQQSEQHRDPSPSLATPPSSSSSAVTDGSSSLACEEARSEEESRSVEASHRDATTQPEHPPSESPMDAAQPGNVEVQQPRTDTGDATEQTGDTVDTGQGIVETVAQGKQDGEEEEAVEKALKLEETAIDEEVPGNTPEFDSEEDGHGVESLDVVSTLDDMAKRIQVEEVGDGCQYLACKCK